VVKWTLNPRGGQRQWTTLEAIAALEDLRTDVRVGDRAGDSDEGDDDDVVTDELGLDVDETASNARGVPAFPHDQTMENVNQDAEQTETSDQAKHEGDAVNGGEEVVQVVQDPVAPPSPYICGRCSKGIDLDSTFYCCVGHSCWGAFTHQPWTFKFYLFYDFSQIFSFANDVSPSKVTWMPKTTITSGGTRSSSFEKA